MKKYKIIFWVSTTLIFLFEGVMPALTSHTEMAREGIRQLGYPAYFATMLAVFKVSGAVVLIVPQFSRRIKEWAYAGFTFNFIAASVSNGAIFGLGAEAFFFKVQRGKRREDHRRSATHKRWISKHDEEVLMFSIQ
ncbi:MAG TPA: DoxX family protein [Chryseolinea sp.]|nr:DoxX family protein [Chryseolinea sp.]